MALISKYEPGVSPQLSTPAASPRSVKAARQFEASLIASLMESMEKTFGTLPGDSEAPGTDNYNYVGTQALGGVIAAQGGFGIANMIIQHLSSEESRHEGKG